MHIMHPANKYPNWVGNGEARHWAWLEIEINIDAYGMGWDTSRIIDGGREEGQAWLICMVVFGHNT
jgi:hypothetical protein